MTFRRPLYTSSPCTTKVETLNKICKVCGDNASIKNYGALSCSSCKTFFRRNGFRPKDVVRCDIQGNCEITIVSRGTCTACRLAKCLAVGMSPDQIRKEDLSKNRSKQRQYLISKNFLLKSPSLLPTLNLLSNDQSSLTPSDWTLLSNVVHAFDKFTPVSKARSIIENLSIQSGLEQSLNFMALIYSSLESFVNSTADFRIMTTEEQQSLVERNMHGLWVFYGTLICREAGVFDNRMNEKIITPLYGMANVQQTKRLAIQLDNDLTFMKLMLISLTFSSNLFAVNEKKSMHKDSLLYGTFRILGSQNVYVEIMWNYMIYRYGFSQTVQRFATFIKLILGMIQLASDINDSNAIHHQLADEIIEQTECSISLNDHENVPLWGKT